MEKVDLREVWTREAEDFTPWLAEDENIKLLGEALGLDLEVQQREAGVGDYRADILCKDASEDRLVVIENQVEETDHKHLGQLVTYAAGLRASIVVWVAKTFTPEHRAALDWLNEYLSGRIRFFGVEIEVWKIEDSRPAPRFNVVSASNAYTDRMQEAVSAARLTESQQLRLKYWAGLADYLKTSGSSLQCKEPSRKTWLRVSCPIAGFRCGFQVSFKNKTIYAFLGTRNEDNVHLLEQIRDKQMKAFERDIGAKAEWEEFQNSIWVSFSLDADPSDAKDWPRQYEWMKSALEKLVLVFAKYAADIEQK